MAGPFATEKEFRTCYHKYTNPVTGETNGFGYWIQFPDNFDELTPFPILILGYGASLKNTSTYLSGLPNNDYWQHNYAVKTGGTMGKWDPDDLSSVYYTYPAFVIIPDTTGCTDEWTQYTPTAEHKLEQEYKWQISGADVNIVYPLKEIVEKLIDQSLVFYESSDCVALHTDIPAQPLIDANRVYAEGYSFGGKMAWNIMREMRDIIAGTVVMAGWSVGAPYVSHANDAEYWVRAKQDIKHIYRIPTIITAGEHDNMWENSVLGHIKPLYEEVATEEGLAQS